YQQPDNGDDNDGELAFVRLRYKLPNSDNSRLLEMPVETSAMQPDLTATNADFRFAAAVAAFGQLLRGSTWSNDYDYADVLTLARGARGRAADGRRGEFLQLVELAQLLSATTNA